jgi:hypothetical protein
LKALTNDHKVSKLGYNQERTARTLLRELYGQEGQSGQGIIRDKTAGMGQTGKRMFRIRNKDRTGARRAWIGSPRQDNRDRRERKRGRSGQHNQDRKERTHPEHEGMDRTDRTGLSGQATLERTERTGS